MKTTWTRIKYGFGSAQRPPPSFIHATSLDAPDLSKIYTFNKDTSIEIKEQDHIIHEKIPTLEPHFPVFTVAIGMLDIFMLIVVYIVQEGTVLTSDTWIKMGSKYVPCMKPLYSKAEQDLYHSGLKSQCQSFLFPYQFFRFFTPIFLHGGITHLLSNLLYQALAGSLLEGRYCVKTLGICYILFGFSGNVMSALCNPKSSK
jgi:membrane associated rhomboid family serine protease